MTRVKTKEIQAELIDAMRQWQAIEDASVESTGRIIKQTNNPLIRMVMEIIQSDSRKHRAVQELIASSLEEQPVSLTPDDLAEVWDGVEKHIALERQMVDQVHGALEEIRGRKMLVQEYLLNYLRVDEKKHDYLLAALETVKRGMYPYGA